MRRAFFAALGLAVAACGVAFSPGDYLAESAPVTADAAVHVDATVLDAAKVADAAPDAAAPPSHVTLLVVGGQRAPLDGEGTAPVDVAELMTTTFDVNGTLGTWQFDAPPGLGAWTRAVLANGTLLVQSTSTLTTAAYTDHVTGPWTRTTFTLPATGVRGWLLDADGLHSGASYTPYNTATAQYFAPLLGDGGLGPWVTAGTVAISRSDVTLVRSGNLAYAVGGQSRTGFATLPSSVVEVGAFDPNDGGLADLTATTPLATDDGGTPYDVFLPVVAADADRVVVAGGETTSAGTTFSDVVLAAHVSDPVTGALDPWITLPPLPDAMNGFALVVTKWAILVLGGADAAGTLHADVLACAINADGTYGTAWSPIGALPEALTGLAGVTF